jgi:DNA-binding transcriptional LysR family regulator
MYYFRVMSDSPFDHARFSLGRLRSFLKVYDAGSIVAAARRAPNVVAQQSQLSRQLSELREVFGTELFEGVGRERRPTPFATKLAQLVRDFEVGLEDLRAGLRAEPLVCAMGAGNSVLHWLLLPHLHAVADKLPAALEPRVRWRPSGLDNDDVNELVEAGRLDFGIVFGRAPRPGTKRTRLGSLDYRLFARRRGRGLPPSWQELVKTAPLAAVTTAPNVEQAIAQLGAEAKSHCDTWPQVASAVRTGRWVGVLPHIARVELTDADYWSVPVPCLGSLSTTLWLASRPRLDDLRPELRPIRDALIAVLQPALRDP